MGDLPLARDCAAASGHVDRPGVFRDDMVEGLPANVSQSITTHDPYPNRMDCPTNCRRVRHIAENSYLMRRRSMSMRRALQAR